MVANKTRLRNHQKHQLPTEHAGKERTLGDLTVLNVSAEISDTNDMTWVLKFRE
jgi:hypothetical protein